MRKALLATFVLSPILLHAQANSAPSQIALASNPAELASADRGTTALKPLRISTGVIAPKLVHSFPVSSEDLAPWTNVPENREVTVGMVVDKSGKPTDLKIIKSAGPVVDRNVLDAVSQYRYAPGTVSNQAVPFPVKLEVNLITTAQ
ncbi:TonB family protein [Edaphobacter modestus]|uniref:TonB family protein n=1 Tax=Edaphobacter modestus TaxID=388466 RepID=A0A4Q7YYL7_9BACT|nr:TonB family protein [Edaphobacter modestus]RZU42848.1 TonB family protein [Edaphobacter modestus]